MKFFIPVLLSLISFFSIAAADLDVKRWKQDIEFYAQSMSERHIDPFHTISKEQFDKQIISLTTSLTRMTKNQLLVALMKLTHSIGDGHTSLPLWGAGLKSFPVEFKMFNGAFYVVATTNEYKHLLGAKLDAINETKSAEMYRLFSELTPFSENKYSEQVRVAQYITKAELLNGLGIITKASQSQFTFTVNDKLVKTQLTPQDSYKYSAVLSYFDPALFPVEEKASDNLWFGASRDNNVVYVKFRRYTSMSKMTSLAEDLLSFINKNQSQKLIIDLRDNYGGDFFVGLTLARFLVLADSIDWKSGVFVLIDNVTFSAAMSNAAQFSQLLNAKLVGQPTGAKPSGYQDMGQFNLPNSGLEVTYSKRLYHFKQDKKDALYPDEHVEISISDYMKNTDTQLKWILNNIDQQLTPSK